MTNPRFGVRRAGPLDARPMVELLNEIIVIGGTTAYVTPLVPEDLRAKMATEGAVWHLAEDDNGNVLGFQWIAPHGDLLQGDVDVATFARVGQTGLGIGSKLFEATRQVARDMGCRWIHAVIRADNFGGLAYYQSRGFEDYRRLPDQKLADGTIVDKIWKRYDLRR